MAVFDTRFYTLGKQGELDVDGYRAALQVALDQCASDAERNRLLREEAVDITRHITDGIRDLVEHDPKIRHLVLNLGAVPLATWAESLDTLAEHSMPALKKKIAQMRRELEEGGIQGFPGTMFLYGKPSFVTFEGFYKAVFEIAEDN